MLTATALGTFAFASIQLRQKFLERTTLSGQILFVALLNFALHLRIAEFEVVLQFFGVHDPDEGSAIPSHEKVITVDVGVLGNLAQIGSGFRKG